MTEPQVFTTPTLPPVGTHPSPTLDDPKPLASQPLTPPSQPPMPPPAMLPPAGIAAPHPPPPAPPAPAPSLAPSLTLPGLPFSPATDADLPSVPVPLLPGAAVPPLAGSGPTDAADQSPNDPTTFGGAPEPQQPQSTNTQKGGRVVSLLIVSLMLAALAAVGYFAYAKVTAATPAADTSVPSTVAPRSESVLVAPIVDAKDVVADINDRPEVDDALDGLGLDPAGETPAEQVAD